MHHRLHGPGRSYPYAWRLPDLARPLGRAAVDRACHALALDLYTLGRFQEALAALPQPHAAEAECLGQRLALLLEHRPPVGETRHRTLDVEEACYLGYLENRPLDWPAQQAVGTTAPEQAWRALLLAWHRARSDRAVDRETLLASSHQALATLRAGHPALAAQGEAVLAETHYWLGPRWATVWLDQALDQADLYGQHHLKARLMGLKARALEAAGELGEGARFRKQARALAERQGARLYLRLFIDEAEPG
jgi:hypothetical protein